MVLAQGGLVSMGIVDTWMIGRVSATAMGAVALGHNVILVVIVVGIGLAMGLEPLVSQAYGAGEQRRADAWLWQGLWTSLFSWPPIVAVVLVIISQLPRFGVEAAIAGPTLGYVLARLPGMLFNLLQAAFRPYLSSIGRTRPVFVAVAAANLLNIALNSCFLFIFDLGAVGVGLSTTGSWGLMMLITGWTARRQAKSPPVGPRLADLKRQLKIGLPIGLHMSAEVGIFSVVAILIARYGPTALAANQIAATMAGFTFMAASGLAVAGSARVGQLVGAGEAPYARRVGLLTFVVGTGIMVSGAILYFIFSDWIVRSFVPHNPEVVPVGVLMLQVVALSSVPDGVQAAGVGILRGYGDTRWPFGAAIIGYWVIGLPIGVALAGPLGFGAVGYWGGITAGLSAVAIALALRFCRLSAGPVARVLSSLSPIVVGAAKRHPEHVRLQLLALSMTLSFAACVPAGTNGAYPLSLRDPAEGVDSGVGSADSGSGGTADSGSVGTADSGSGGTADSGSGGNSDSGSGSSGNYKVFRVDGTKLLDPCGNEVVIRGVNVGSAFPTDTTGAKAPEVGRTGANAVRITFRTRYNNSQGSELAAWIEAAAAQGMISIPGYWDATGKWENMSSAEEFWLRSDIQSVLKQYSDRIIVNIANEGGDIVENDDFRAVYTRIIKRYREAGLHMPLMIDAAHWGRDPDYIIENGKYLLEQDPDHNILFGWHPWDGGKSNSYYDDNLDKFEEQGLCVLISEYNRYGATAADQAQGEIPYKHIMQTAQERKVGWLWWWWASTNSDGEPDIHSLTSNGNYDSMLDMGREVCLDSAYGIQKTSQRSPYFTNNFTCNE